MFTDILLHHSWPQFGPLGSLPQHGFARNSLWSIKDTAADTTNTNNDAVRVTLFLEDNQDTRTQWNNNAFRLEYEGKSTPSE